MTSHHKAASCSFIPSMHSLSSMYKEDIHRNDFPLPSFCLYSKSALLNEYTPESDIIQYLHPKSPILEERLPMFVGVLQSLFTVVNDLPFNDEKQEPDDEQEEEEEDEEEDDEQEEEEEEQFIIIGLNSIKLIVWKDMYDHIIDEDHVYKNDLCLVIIVSSHLTDTALIKNMKLLEKSIMKDISSCITTHEIGNLLRPSVEYWFVPCT